MPGALFHIDQDGNPSEMVETPYTSEDLFQ